MFSFELELFTYSGEPPVELVVGFTGPDTIKIWWDRVNDMRTYIRYQGRDDIEDQ